MTHPKTGRAQGPEEVCPCRQDLIRSNIRLNRHTIDSAGGTATAHELTWGATQNRQLPQRWRAPDVVLAADVVYRQELFQPLLEALEMLSKYCSEKSRTHFARALRHTASIDSSRLQLLC